MDASYWREKLEEYRAGNLPEEEWQSLWEALAKDGNAPDWQALILELSRQAQPGRDYRNEDWEPVLQAIFRHGHEVKRQAVLHRMRIIRRWAVAAVLVLGLGFGIYKALVHTTQMPTPTLASQDVPAPKRNRATITLGSGQQIVLDTATNGQLAKQGGARILKLADGQIRYQGLAQGKLIYNTITNPRGSGVINLTLSDGTRIWLNAASSLRYPAAFAGAERRVEITGEAFFEVAHNDRQPFRVQAGRQLIEDLGTQFNINAYSDEPVMKTTLLEGAVKVGDLLLHPGEQASANPLGHIDLIKNADLEEVLAWKNGQFRFHSADIGAVLRQASRWYGVDIGYRGLVNGTISGGISRSVNISQLLHILELTRKLTFSMEGKTIIVQAVNDR